MDDKAFEELLDIRNGGKVNMLDIHAVQREAYEKGFYELLVFIEEHRTEYAEVIMFGRK